MRNLLIAACCAALLGSVSVASAQTSGPAAQDSMKTHNPMDSNAKMKKKTAKKSTKSDDSTKSDAPKDDTAKKDAK
jgi:pentapeptide MXKDX repeat protein